MELGFRISTPQSSTPAVVESHRMAPMISLEALVPENQRRLPFSRQSCEGPLAVVCRGLGIARIELIGALQNRFRRRLHPPFLAAIRATACQPAPHSGKP